MSEFGTENIYGEAGASGESAAAPKAARGLYKQAAAGKQRYGRGPFVDTRIFKHDRVSAREHPTDWYATKDDRMSPDATARMVERVQEAYGLSAAPPGVLESLWEAIFYYHTVNSGSTAQPGRGAVTVAGEPFDYQIVLGVLGTDLRRFFRTNANEVRETNKKVLTWASSPKIDEYERYQWLVQVAAERGLARYPDLAHDSAEACWNLDPAERAALANSKTAVTSSTSNFVDTVSANSRTPAQRGTVFDNPAVGRGYDA